MFKVEKITRVNAAHFTGGEENAKTLIDWLISFDLGGEWQKTYSGRLNGEDGVVTESTETLVIENANAHPFARVPVGCWILLSEPDDVYLNPGVTVVSDEAFEKDYRKVDI